MALAPADFYAYSRATGTPVPEDPEERAQMAPEVLEFRRNQLKAPQQESNPLAALGTVAAGLGLLAGGLYAAKRFGAGRAVVAPSKVPNLTQQGISDVSAVAKQQNAERVQRELSKQRPQGVVQTDLGFVDELLNDPSLLSQVEYQEFTEGLTGPALSQLRGAESRARNEYRGLVTEIGDQIIEEERAKILSQTVGALESGEDQVTERIMRGVQRNEDLDSSQVNQLKQQTGDVISATSLTPDGVPQDQTDLWGAATIPQIRQQQNDYGPSPLKLLPSSTQGRQQRAQSFLQQKREQLMQIFSPTRAERVLASDPAVAEAAELYASTGDPNVLSRFASAPSSPITIKPMVQMAINQEELPTKFFFQPTGYPEYVGDLLEEDIELTNRISELGAQKQNLIDKASELGEQELMLRVAMEREPASGGAYTKMFAQVKNQQQNLPNPESLNVDLGDAMAQRDFVRNLMESLQNLGSTYRLTNVQEGVRPYFEYDELNRIIPSTLELRGGRQSVDFGPKTRGGRLFAEYDPEGQTGSTKGIYGVEQTAKQSSAATRPTQLTMSELVREGLEQASASPEGDVPLPPSISQITERRPTAAAKRSLEASEIVRRAIIEGRDPQMVLRQRGFKV
jgi:hypothetical protein